YACIAYVHLSTRFFPPRYFPSFCIALQCLLGKLSMSLLWAAPAGLRTGCDAIVKPLAAIVAALSLAGCTTFAIPDDGPASVEALPRTGLDATPEAATLQQPSDPAVVSAQVEQLLQQPLSSDTAVRLALLQNSQLRG